MLKQVDINVMQSQNADGDCIAEDALLKALTIRNIPPAVADALEREKSRRGLSLNQTVVELLAQGLGVGGARSNGLRGLAGGWSEADLTDFERALAPFDEVDGELWREGGDT